MQLSLTPTNPMHREVLRMLDDGASFTPPADDGWPFPIAQMTEGSLGHDLAPCTEVVVPPGEAVVAPSGWSLAEPLPENTALLVLPRSSLFLKRKLLVANSPGLIDRDYRGDLGIVLYNPTSEPVTLEAGARVAQLLLVPIIPAQFALQLDQSAQLARDGFGHTDNEVSHA